MRGGLKIGVLHIKLKFLIFLLLSGQKFRAAPVVRLESRPRSSTDRATAF